VLVPGAVGGRTRGRGVEAFKVMDEVDVSRDVGAPGLGVVGGVRLRLLRPVKALLETGRDEFLQVLGQTGHAAGLQGPVGGDQGGVGTPGGVKARGGFGLTGGREAGQGRREIPVGESGGGGGELAHAKRFREEGADGGLIIGLDPHEDRRDVALGQRGPGGRDDRTIKTVAVGLNRRGGEKYGQGQSGEEASACCFHGKNGFVP